MSISKTDVRRNRVEVLWGFSVVVLFGWLLSMFVTSIGYTTVYNSHNVYILIALAVLAIFSGLLEMNVCKRELRENPDTPDIRRKEGCL